MLVRVGLSILVKSLQKRDLLRSILACDKGRGQVKKRRMGPVWSCFRLRSKSP